MQDFFKESLWKNFAAAIDMLRDSVALCPDELWQSERKFFYLAYHTTIFLDYYLSIPARDFSPQLPYTLVDSDQLPPGAIDDVLPAESYSRKEMLSYLSAIRKKAKTLITLADEEKWMAPWISKEEVDLHGLCPSLVVDYTVIDILFYNFRHVQHHVAQLNWILRQNINQAPDWVSHAW